MADGALTLILDDATVARLAEAAALAGQTPDIRALTRDAPIIPETVDARDVVAILRDSAMGLAVQTTLPQGFGYTTLEFKISFVRGMSQDTGTIRTEGKVLNAGRRVATAEARITDGKGKLIAHATTTCLVFELPKAN